MGGGRPADPPSILIGIDDTDLADTPGTNRLARRIAETLPAGLECDLVVRHQLLLDPRIPYTSRNGSASIGIRTAGRRIGPGIAGQIRDELVALLRRSITEFAPDGSDPGLCIAPWEAAAIPALLAFGERCGSAPVEVGEARALARRLGVHLEPLGGSGQGVVGALAAVALRAGGNDGRVVHARGWPWPDDFGGTRSVEEILARGVDEVLVRATGEVARGAVDLGKRLRPNLRAHRVVLWVEPAPDHPAPWRALKLS